MKSIKIFGLVKHLIMKYTITFVLFLGLFNTFAQSVNLTDLVKDSTMYTVTTVEGSSFYVTYTTETYYAKGLAVKVVDWDLGTLEYVPVSVKRTYTVQNLVTIVSTVTEIQDKEGNYLDINDFVTIYEEKKKLSIK